MAVVHVSQKRTRMKILENNSSFYYVVTKEDTPTHHHHLDVNYAFRNS